MAQTKHPMKAQQSRADVKRRNQGIRVRRKTHQQSDSLLSNYCSAYKLHLKKLVYHLGEHNSNAIPNDRSSSV
jgi:hypothetical protein